MQPLISVIIPIYNVEAYLERCIRSVLEQTYHNLEIILVDDGSPDGCGAICDRYKEQDERIVVIHKENGGLSDARNKGLDIAKGEYILFVDSDDWIHGQMVEVLYEVIRQQKCDVAICDYQYAYEKKDYPDKQVTTEYILNQIKEIGRFEAQDIYFTNPEQRNKFTVAWNKLYKTSLFGDIRYPKGKVHEDEYTTFKLLYKAEKIAVTDEKLYYYFVRENSIMGEFKINRFDIFDGYLEKFNCYVQWNEDELAKKMLFHAMHMLAQYRLWSESSNKSLYVNCRDNYKKIKDSMHILCNYKIIEKMEMYIFRINFELYYYMWKWRRR